MIEITHERVVDLPADLVWEEVRHFDRVLNWIPGGADSSISVTGHGVGMVRDIELSTMGYVQHRLLSYDNQTRSFSYALTDGKPLGMQDYAVVLTVTPIDARSCQIRWAGEMTADQRLDEAETGRALEMALANMTTGIIAVLKQEPPNFTRQLKVDF